jgi:hypothetical protein
MSDKQFKNSEIQFPKELNLNQRSNGKIIGNDKYKPDKSFNDSNGSTVLIIESTSTGDRKVSIGELCQAEKFFTDNNISGTLIFSLCGKSENSPRPDTQYEYLMPYFKFMKNSNPNLGVTKINIILEADFKALGWKALDENFKAKAKCLS